VRKLREDFRRLWDTGFLDDLQIEVVNAEYYFDVVGPLRVLLFFDAGQSYGPGQGMYWRTMSTSTGVEARFTMPVLSGPSFGCGGAALRPKEKNPS
jgi:hypothetical protein